MASPAGACRRAMPARWPQRSSRRWHFPVEQREALGHRARAAVLRRYTVAAMQAATLDVYEQVVGLAACGTTP